MLDEKDLQAIAQLLAQQKSEIVGELRTEMDARFAEQESKMDARFAQQKSEIVGGLRTEMDARFVEQESRIDARFAQQKKEIMHEVNLLMESYFDPKFNHLADELELMKEKLIGREEVEEASDRIDVLEAVVKIHSREIEKLKKSNHIA